MRKVRASMLRALPALALALSSMAAQQAGTDSARVYELDPVTVTGTALEALRSSVPNAVTVVDRKTLRESGETSVLPVLARTVPGLFVTERGVLGYGVGQGAGGIYIRGAGGNPNTQVLVLTDGTPNIMGLFGHPLPDMFLTAGVERVEVIRGPASFLHGGNAMGGVVNIISRRPAARGLDWNAGISGGSYSTARAEATVRYGMENSGLSVWGSRYQTDGHRPSSSFRSTNLSVRGETAFSPSLRLSVNSSISSFRTFDPGPESAPYSDNWIDIFRLNAGAALENGFGLFRGGVKLFLNYGDHDIYDGFRSRDHLAGVLLYQGFTPFRGTTVTAGLDHRVSGGVASNVKSGVDFGTHGNGESGVYLLVQQDVQSLFRLSTGLRYHHHETAGGALIPQFGLSAGISSGTVLKLMAARGFRNPTIRELYLFPAPTPTLKPERSWSYEASVLQEVGASAHVEITGFLSEGDNLIRTSGVYPNVTLGNSGRFTHRGVEAAAAWQPWSKLGLEATYTALDPGDQTMANPAHKLWLSARTRFDPVSLAAGVQYVSGLYGKDFGKSPLSEYLLVNARVNVDIVSRLAAFLSVDNILDRRYEILAGYPMPGTTLMMGLNWRDE